MTIFSDWALWSKPPQRLMARSSAAPRRGRRGVAEVMGERQRLGQILVEAEGPGERARDLRDLERMGEARAVMVALVLQEDLRLVLEAAEGGRVDDPVAVALEFAARRRWLLGTQPAATPVRIGGIDGAPAPARPEIRRTPERLQRIRRGPRC